MLQNMEQIARAGDLRRRILFTLLMFAVFRLGIYIPVPGVDSAALSTLVKSGGVTLFGLLNLFSGGAFFTFSVFAMSIVPYINASIIMQLLTVVIPKVEELQKEGAEGQKKINQWTRYLTVGLALVQAFGTTVTLNRLTGVVNSPGIGSILLITLVLTAGSVFLMWIGEMITEFGIGNGASLIIFIGIVSQLPSGVSTAIQYLQAGTISIVEMLVLLVIAVLVIAVVIVMQEGERRIPVQYAKRLVGRRMYQGTSSHIPIKVNAAGVIPLIFAVSLLFLPQTLASFFPKLSGVAQFLSMGQPFMVVVEFLLVVAFTFFYTGVVFKPNDVADNIRKMGGFIPGIRPGRPTAQYLEKVSSRLTLIGAVFLGLIAVLPYLIFAVTNIQVFFGGTALLIVVGVALDTMKQIQAQMIMRNYSGFLKS